VYHADVAYCGTYRYLNMSCAYMCTYFLWEQDFNLSNYCIDAGGYGLRAGAAVMQEARNERQQTVGASASAAAGRGDEVPPVTRLH
jgi:hypothetical protein